MSLWLEVDLKISKKCNIKGQILTLIFIDIVFILPYKEFDLD